MPAFWLSRDRCASSSCSWPGGKWYWSRKMIVRQEEHTHEGTGKQERDLRPKGGPGKNHFVDDGRSHLQHRCKPWWLFVVEDGQARGDGGRARANNKKVPQDDAVAWTGWTKSKKGGSLGACSKRRGGWSAVVVVAVSSTRLIPLARKFQSRARQRSNTVDTRRR